MNKKTQAAMEFLLTYGWAITVVVVAIAALAYFGVLDPGKWLVTSTCMLPAGLSCLDHTVTYKTDFAGNPNNEITLYIKNNLGAKYKIPGNTNHFKFTKPVVPDTNYLFDTQYIANNGDTFKNNFEIPLTISSIKGLASDINALLPGQKYQIEFVIVAQNDETELPHSFAGRITGKVQ